jgi:hypothetical protein
MDRTAKVRIDNNFTPASAALNLRSRRRHGDENDRLRGVVAGGAGTT